jgi:hypothetical protein
MAPTVPAASDSAGPPRRLMTVIWPAFVAACLLEALVFALVDPQDLRWTGHQLALSRDAVYTLAFFVFWLASMVSSALTALLSTRLSGRPWG